MSRIFADQIQKPSGTAFSLPVGNGANNQFIQTDGQGNLSFENPVIYQPGESWLVAPETAYNIGTVVSHSDRQNIYSTGEWGSSSSWTTYSNYQVHQDNSGIQFWNMLLGDGYSNASATSEYMQGADTENELPRRVQFASGNRVGYRRDIFHYDNSQGYAGHTFRCLPLRNTNSGSVSVSITGLVSNYWSSGYEGAQIAYFTPNTNKYSTVTSVTGTSVANITSSNTRAAALTGSVTIPGGTTVLVTLTSTDWYETTYRFKDCNLFYKLHETFTGTNGVICDMRMLSHLVRGRVYLPYTGALATNLAPIWTTCATQYGDR
jgi:hypothetical protein